MKSERKKRFHFDVEKYERPIRVAGWFMAVFTLFSLLSVVSYFFTWKLDQSLLLDPEMMDRAVEVSNLGGKAGLRWSYFLVGKSFGVASLLLVAFLDDYLNQLP